MRCLVCGSSTGAPVLVWDDASSLTSLCTIEAQATVVHRCPTCAHVQTRPMADLADYYARHYTILIDSEEEDQIYRVDGDTTVYRADHQAATLLATTPMAEGAAVLDYGAAKSATMRRIASQRPDLDVHLFDVSEMYVPFWQSFVTEDRWACFDVPDDWRGRFSVITSFFMLEHADDPAGSVSAMAALLAPGGRLHLVIPNPLVNVADFVVIDHVNHFTAPSLHRVLTDAGLVLELLDDAQHDGAWVAVARRDDGPDGRAPVAPPDTAPSLAAVEDLAVYWSGINGAVAAIEQQVGGGRLAIYGAGFYGSLLFSRLAHADAVEAFVDRNPFLQGRTHLGIPVVRPDALDASVTDVLVGLNPNIARAAIADVGALQERGLRFHFLDAVERGA